MAGRSIVKNSATCFVKSPPIVCMVTSVNPEKRKYDDSEMFISSFDQFCEVMYITIGGPSVLNAPPKQPATKPNIYPALCFIVNLDWVFNNEYTAYPIITIARVVLIMRSGKLTSKYIPVGIPGIAPIISGLIFFGSKCWWSLRKFNAVIHEPLSATRGVTKCIGKRNGNSDIDTRAEPKLVIACTNADINTIMNEVMYCSSVKVITPLIIKTKNLLHENNIQRL